MAIKSFNFIINLNSINNCIIDIFIFGKINVNYVQGVI